jgi:hypothetical protein
LILENGDEILEMCIYFMNAFTHLARVHDLFALSATFQAFLCFLGGCKLWNLKNLLSKFLLLSFAYNQQCTKILYNEHQTWNYACFGEHQGPQFNLL